MSPNVGTPDWQRGIVSAGLLIGTASGSQPSITVDIPPNAQTIVVAFTGGGSPTSITCQGVTTGNYYPGAYRKGSASISSRDTYLFMVSSQLDDQVTITPLPNVNYGDWSVYSQSGVNIVDVPEILDLLQIGAAVSSGQGVNIFGSDGVRARIISVDSNGRQVPLVPAVGNKVAVAVGTTQVVAAPTSGEWYLYGLDVEASGGVATTVTLTDSTGNTIAEVSVLTANDSKSVDLSGFVTSGSVSVTATAAATVTIRYALGP